MSRWLPEFEGPRDGNSEPGDDKFCNDEERFRNEFWLDFGVFGSILMKFFFDEWVILEMRENRCP